MIVALVSSLPYHYEILPFFIDYFLSRGCKIDIYLSRDLDDNVLHQNWVEFLYQLYNCEVTTGSITNIKQRVLFFDVKQFEIDSRALYDLVVLPTEGDPIVDKIQNHVNLNNKVLVMRHTGDKEKPMHKYQFELLTRPFLKQNVDILQPTNIVLPLFTRLYQESDRAKRERLKKLLMSSTTPLIVLIVGDNFSDPNVMRRVQCESRPIRFVYIGRHAPKNKHAFHKVHLNITATELYDHAMTSDYILVNKKSESVYTHTIISGSVPLALANHTPLIMSREVLHGGYPDLVGNNCITSYNAQTIHENIMLLAIPPRLDITDLITTMYSRLDTVTNMTEKHDDTDHEEEKETTDVHTVAVTQSRALASTIPRPQLKSFGKIQNRVILWTNTSIDTLFDDIGVEEAIHKYRDLSRRCNPVLSEAVGGLIVVYLRGGWFLSKKMSFLRPISDIHIHLQSTGLAIFNDKTNTGMNLYIFHARKNDEFILGLLEVIYTAIVKDQNQVKAYKSYYQTRDDIQLQVVPEVLHPYLHLPFVEKQSTQDLRSSHNEIFSKSRLEAGSDHLRNDGKYIPITHAHTNVIAVMVPIGIIGTVVLLYIIFKSIIGNH